VYDWLLFLHLLAAFLLSVTAVTYSAVALGAPAGGRTLFVADRCWDVGGLGTLVFGVWLALYLDQYEIWDGWIIGAFVLWLVATGLGDGARRRLAGAEAGESRAALLHWLRTLAVLGLLVLMVWKPGA
jgi:cell division protein FtsW (lipid II flippase)